MTKRYPGFATCVAVLGLALLALGILAQNSLAQSSLAQSSGPTAPGPSEEASDFGLPTALVVDPLDPLVIYAGFLGYGLFKSPDGGETWLRLSDGLPGDLIAGLAIDPFNPGVLYALEAGHGLLKSEDGGLHWRPAGFGLRVAPHDIHEIALDPDEPLTAYASTRRGLFRSLDGAESFEIVPQGPSSASQVLFHPFDSVLFYVLSDDKLFVSSDFAQSFQVLGDLGDAQRHVVIDPFRPEILHAAGQRGVTVSVDGGRTWTSAGLAVSAWRLAYDANGNLLAATDQGLFRRLGPSDPWAQLTERSIQALAVHPFDPRALYLSDKNGEVLGSQDGGLNLERKMRAAVPPPATLGQKRSRPSQPAPPRIRLASATSIHNPVATLAIDPDDPSVVYAGTRHGVFRGTDYGDHWQIASHGLELLDVHALAVDPELTSTLYAGTHGAGLFRSTDSGRTWVPARNGLGLASIAGLAVDPLEPSVIYVGGRGGLFTSRDHGQHWTPLLDDTNASEIRSLEYLLGQPLELVAGTADGHVLGWDVTAELGKPSQGLLLHPGLSYHPSFSAPTAPIPRALEIRGLTAHPDDISALYAATALGLHHSRDGGLSWRLLATSRETPENVTSVALDPIDPSIAYLGTTEGVLRRQDGHWSRFKIRGVSRKVAVYSLAVAAEDLKTVIYAGLEDGRVAISRDSGQTWRVRRLRPRPSAPASRGKALFVGAGASGSNELRKRLTTWYEETPSTATRLRTRLALELEARFPGETHQNRQTVGQAVPDDFRPDKGIGRHSLPYGRSPRSAEPLADDQRISRLEHRLSDIRDLQLQRGEEQLTDLRFSADSRWLLAEHRFDDGSRSHSEMRLYDLQGIQLRRDGLTFSELDLHLASLVKRDPRARSVVPARPHWRALADVDREPEHLHPSWLIADPGEHLAWSPDGRFLATRRDADQVAIWRVARPPRDEASRFEPRAPAAPTEQRLKLLAPGVGVRAWRHDGRYLALAGRHRTELPHTVVYMADLERKPAGTLEPVRVPFQDQIRDLRFTREGRWLWIRTLPLSGDEHHALLLARSSLWRLVLSHDGGLWRIASQSRLPRDFKDAPEAFVQLAASADGRWLAGRGAAAGGTARGEVLLWKLGRLGPEGSPVVVPGEVTGKNLRFSADSKCLLTDGRADGFWPLAADNEAWCRNYRWSSRENGGALKWPLAETPESPPELALTSGFELEAWRQAVKYGWGPAHLSMANHRRPRISPDHRWLVASSWSPIVGLWNLDRAEPAALVARTGRFSASHLHRDEAARSSRGLELLYWSPAVSRRPGDPLVVFDRACQVLGRNWTRAEWHRYLGDIPYEPVCEFRRPVPAR